MNTTYDEFRTTENNIAKVREYHYELEHKTRKWCETHCKKSIIR